MGAFLDYICMNRGLRQRLAGLGDLVPDHRCFTDHIFQRRGSWDWSEGRWGFLGLVHMYEAGAIL